MSKQFSHDPLALLPPRILVVDDEKQIHASLRLRLAGEHDLVFCANAHDALQKVAAHRFDLCFADIHMPQMDGLRFIDAARKVDPLLGYVVLSAFDSDENLRRTIPLQVYDFISKPLPERHQFEARIPDWIETTRKRRREHDLAQQAHTLATERDTARMERDVELIASESTRDAMMQTARLLSTIDAHYVSACALLATRVRADPSLRPLLRSMEEGRRASEAAITVAETFLGSAYGSRDTSPALINEGIRDAINLARRDPRVEQLQKMISFTPLDTRIPLRGLSGIGFLLMMFSALEAAIVLAPPNSTVAIRGEYIARIDALPRDSRFKSHVWLNRRNSLGSHPAWLLSIATSATALTQDQLETWLKGEYAPLHSITPRGLIEGIQKCHGLLGFSAAPQSEHFKIILALPTE